MTEPTSTVGDVRRLFADEHVHAALIGDGHRLLAVVDRSALAEGQLTHTSTDSRPAATMGRLCGRVVHDTTSLDEARRMMHRSGRRRLAVIDVTGRCVGLLCLKRGRHGFCSDDDDDVAARRGVKD